MKTSLYKPVQYRVLIIEDDPDWFINMDDMLKDFAEDQGITLETVLVDNSEAAQRIMGREIFHAAAIDLRLPENPGAPLTPAPRGIDLAALETVMPMAWAHIYTAWAKEHALETYRKLSNSNGLLLPFWEKSGSDDSGTDRYTQKEWAQRILTIILPRAEALAVPLVLERGGFDDLEQCSPLGIGVDFAVNAGCKHLPPGLARNCAMLDRWLATGEARHELAAWTEALFMAEIVQHWLWVQAAAWLTAMGLPQRIAWPIRDRNGKPTRTAVEQALQTMIQAIADSLHAEFAATWLSYLHYSDTGQTMGIIDALAAIRELRNSLYHQNPTEILPWQALALPLRVVLDAASFLAAYPVLTRPNPAPDGRWRFTVFKGESSPFPEQEWSLAGGVLGMGSHFAPKREDLKLYQLWPNPEGGYSLLKLWPFAEHRISPDSGRTVWLVFGPDSRNPQRLWERSALDGRESCTTDIATERLTALAALGAGG